MEGVLFFAACGMVCFVVYDIWTVRNMWGRWPRLLFTAGVLCFAVATGIILIGSVQNVGAAMGRAAVLWVCAAGFLWLLCYTLFFALPFEETYLQPEQKRPVYCRGMYALCRHPGVVWFTLFYVCLYAAVPSTLTLWGGAALCAGNLAYIVIQDLWTFPRTFSNYSVYRRQVPFLIPTPASIRCAITTRPNRRHRP